MKTKLYSYVLRFDSGAAPNPFWGNCTLTICKPDIRRKANIGDWIIGTGSKNARLYDGNTYDLSDSIVYAMKVTKKLSLAEYDRYCRQYLAKKIPQWFNRDFRLRVGDCIYDYSAEDGPKLRKSVHNLDNLKRDLGGQFALVSKHFYYFGEEPRRIPQELKYIIRKGQKHLVFEDPATVLKFEAWISKFSKNKIYSNPQLKFEFDLSSSEDLISKCSKRHLKE